MRKIIHLIIPQAALKPETSATPFKLASVVLVVGVVAHTLSLFGSSFVEEEHQTFYFFLTSALLVVLLCCVRCCFITFGGQQVNVFLNSMKVILPSNTFGALSTAPSSIFCSSEKRCSIAISRLTFQFFFCITISRHHLKIN
jgi:hypothetical protein